MTPRDRVRVAMALGKPDVVPVQCQMATGHILLNTGIDPVAEATDSVAFAESLLQMRDQYDFDGILIHKPGREPGWLDGCQRRDCAEGWEFVAPDGCVVRVQREEDPVLLPAPPFQWPDVETIDPADPFGEHFPGIYRRWHHFKGTHGFHRVEDIPESWYGCIDYLADTTKGRISLHGETRAPFDHVLNLLGTENMMVALFTHPEKIHALFAWATQSSITWAVAQIRRGCDAIKVSSPWVGAGFISREHYREFVVPYERALADAVRAEGGFIYTHTCGRIGDRLEEMMATNTNGLECLDPPPLGDVEIEDAVERTRGRVFIKGNVDSVHTLLHKDRDGVANDVRRVVNAAAPGGGFICSTACSIAPHVPPDNVKTMVEVARNYAR